MRRGGRMGQVAVGIALRQVQRASSLTGHSHWQITPVACTATKCRSTPKCRMNDSSTLCSMNMIRRQSTVTFTFSAGLKNGIGSMSVPSSTVSRESGFPLGACGKALPDPSSQGLSLRLTSSN